MKLILECPVCGCDSEHEVLKKGKESLVRCIKCAHVHRADTKTPEERMLRVRTIVSSEGDSRVCTSEMLPEEECGVGEMRVAECRDGAVGVEVTGIETAQGRVDRAKGREIVTLWTRAIEKVVVRVSIHSGRITTPIYIASEGDEAFQVGSEYRHGRLRFRISHMKLRDGRVIREAGRSACAREIRRIYAYMT